VTGILRRRSVISAGGAVLAAGIAARASFGAPEVIEIHMRSDPEGSHVGFDPVGILIRRSQTVRWVCDANVHTTAAYHPANEQHPLRIPRAAKPWVSDYLLPGDIFEVVLSVEGVYDYFCAPHEHAGMVGRIIVGRPGGPGSLPFDYFKGGAAGRRWLDVPVEARAVFPAIAEIMRRRVVPATERSCHNRIRYWDFAGEGKTQPCGTGDSIAPQWTHR
jgi:plastocyanin